MLSPDSTADTASPDNRASATVLAQAVLGLLFVVCVNVTANGSELVVLGDSWGVGFAAALRRTLDAEGLRDVQVVPGAVPGQTAANMARPTTLGGLDYVSSVLAANPDAKVVHLSIGGNDFLNSWNNGLSASAEEQLFANIETNTNTIVEHILAVAPQVEIFHSSYDFVRPLSIGSPLEINTAALAISQRASQTAQQTDRYTYYDYYGRMQWHYGLPDLGIPPFDPSLPRVDQPSPAVAFYDDIHLTAAGYRLLADEEFDVFLAPIFVPEPGSGYLVLLGILALVIGRKTKTERNHGGPRHLG